LPVSKYLKIHLQFNLKLVEVTLSWRSSVIFIRNDSAEIRAFRNGLTLVIGTKKNIAGTGVFVRVVCALNCATKSDPSQPSMVMAHRRDLKSHSPKNEVQVGNSTERGNEKITPSEGKKNL
jgi:hypothetical protein